MTTPDLPPLPESVKDVPRSVAMSLEILVRTAQYFGRVGPSVAGAKELQYVHHCAHDAIRAALAAERETAVRECIAICSSADVVRGATGYISAMQTLLPPETQEVV